VRLRTRALRTHPRRLDSRRLPGRLVHLPIHASWLNQIELYFSIVQRKALSPNSFDSLDELADRLLRFGEHYRQIARPFDWTFTRADLERVLAKITEREPRLALAA
jgi:transposase